jgi:hypothetical protein
LFKTDLVVHLSLYNKVVGKSIHLETHLRCFLSTYILWVKCLPNSLWDSTLYIETWMHISTKNVSQANILQNRNSIMKREEITYLHQRFELLCPWKKPSTLANSGLSSRDLFTFYGTQLSCEEIFYVKIHRNLFLAIHLCP